MPGVTHDTLHTQPQLIPPPCFILSIVQRISPGLLKIFYTSIAGHIVLGASVRVYSVFILMHPRREH